MYVLSSLNCLLVTSLSCHGSELQGQEEAAVHDKQVGSTAVNFVNATTL